MRRQTDNSFVCCDGPGGAGWVLRGLFLPLNRRSGLSSGTFREQMAKHSGPIAKLQDGLLVGKREGEDGKETACKYLSRCSAEAQGRV